MFWALLFSILQSGSGGLTSRFAAQQKEIKNVVSPGRARDEISDGYKKLLKLLKNDTDARSQILKNLLAWGQDPNAKQENLTGLLRAYDQERGDIEATFIAKRMEVKKLFKEDEWARLIQKTSS
jgi:predicted Rossmann fold nucleotide-binding protein DprA/Smf involved in DNA uptake